MANGRKEAVADWGEVMVGDSWGRRDIRVSGTTGNVRSM
jgi:hypothetical protein